jgi:cystathionine beta-lyase/cystathionine gamma-synthase
VLGGALVAREESPLFARVRRLQASAGAGASAFDSWLVLRGVRSLPARMRVHGENAGLLATFLAAHPAVERVFFPGLPDHPGHEIAKRQMRDFGAMVSIELKADIEETRKFTGNIELWTLAESLGGVKSLLCQPATMTHASVDPAMRRQVGIADGLIRLSVGLEDVRDLIRDLEQALEKVRTAVAVA